MLTLHRDLSSRPRTRRHVQPQSPTLQAILFFYISLPQNKGGGVGWGRTAAAAKIRSCRSSSSSVPGGNEINTANDKIGFAPAELLYSESLTKSTKKNHSKNL